MLLEVIEETIGLEKVRDHFHSLTMVLDLLIDDGLPLLPEKPILAAILQQGSTSAPILLLNKATKALAAAGGDISDSKHSQVMQGVLSQQIAGNTNANWRWS